MFCHLQNCFLATCFITRAYESVGFQHDWRSPTTMVKPIIRRMARVQPAKGSWMWIFRLIWEPKFTVKWTAARSSINRQILIGRHFNLCSVRQSIYSNFALRSPIFRDNGCRPRFLPTIPTTTTNIKWATTLWCRRPSFSYLIPW